MADNAPLPGPPTSGETSAQVPYSDDPNAAPTNTPTPEADNERPTRAWLQPHALLLRSFPIALSLSIFTIVLLIALYIVQGIPENHFSTGWQTDESLRVLAVVTTVTLLLSAYSTIRTRRYRQRQAISLPTTENPSTTTTTYPLPINNLLALILDLVAAFYALAYAIQGLGDIPRAGWCSIWNEDGDNYDYDRQRICNATWGTATRVLAGVIFGLGTVIGLLYLATAVVRCVLIAKGSRRSSTGAAAFKMPRGGVSFEFSIRFFDDSIPPAKGERRVVEEEPETGEGQLPRREQQDRGSEAAVNAI